MELPAATQHDLQPLQLEQSKQQSENSFKILFDRWQAIVNVNFSFQAITGTANETNHERNEKKIQGTEALAYTVFSALLCYETHAQLIFKLINWFYLRGTRKNTQNQEEDGGHNDNRPDFAN